jgi:hypothetical protein
MIKNYNYYDESNGNYFYLDDYNPSIGERWDTISNNVYGRPDLYYIILECNLQLSDDERQSLAVISEDLVLKIPDLDLDLFDYYNLPDWRISLNAT